MSDTTIVIVFDETYALLGGMTGQGKSTAMQKCVADLLKRARKPGTSIVVGDLKATA